MEEEVYYDEYEIDLREYIMLLWNNKWFIIGLFIVAVLAAAIVSQYYLTPVYQTEAVVHLSNVESLYSQPNSVRQIMKSDEIVKPVMEEYNQEYTEQGLRSYINNNIDISSGAGERILNIRVKNKNPELARKLILNMVDSFEKETQSYYQNYISTQEEYINTLERELEKISSSIVNTEKSIEEMRKLDISAAEKGILLNEQINKLNSLQSQKDKYLKEIQNEKNELLKIYPVRILNDPYLPDKPISPNKKLNVAIAGVLALMLGVFIVFFREFLREEE